MHEHAIPLFLRVVFQIPIRISQLNGKKKIQKQISQHDPSVEIKFLISRLIANPKSRF